MRFLCWQGAPFADADEVAQENADPLYESWPIVRDKPAWARKVDQSNEYETVWHTTQTEPATISAAPTTAR